MSQSQPGPEILSEVCCGTVGASTANRGEEPPCKEEEEELHMQPCPSGDPKEGQRAELKQEPEWEWEEEYFTHTHPLLGDTSAEAEGTTGAAAAANSGEGPLCKEEEDDLHMQPCPAGDPEEGLQAKLKQEQEGEDPAQGLKIECVWSMATRSEKVLETLRHHRGSSEDGGVRATDRFSPCHFRASRRLRSEKNKGPASHLKQQQNGHPLGPPDGISTQTTEQQVSLYLEMSDDKVEQTEEDAEVMDQNASDQEHQVFPYLETSDDEEEESDEEEEREKEGIQGNPPSKIPKAMDHNVHGSNPQQHIKVKTSSNTAHQRIYYKRNYCLYCEKPFVKITRHLKEKHSDEVEVAMALACSQGSTRYNLLLSKVRNMGNYHHNCSVLSSGKGQIIPKKQATYQTTATDYLPCKFCFAMYVKKDLWKHHKRCRLQVKEDRPVKRKVQACCSLMLPMDTTITSGIEQILQDMSDDTVTEVVKSDKLILSLGERMFLKNGEVGRHRADIRNKMRQLARLVLEARKTDKDIVFLEDLIHPGRFNKVLEAVKKMTRFDNLTNRFSVPSTALKLRHSLVKVSYILQGEALRQEDDALKARAAQFIKLIELEWTTRVIKSEEMDIKVLQGGMDKLKGKSLEEIAPNINSEGEFSDPVAEDIQSEWTATTSQDGNSEDGHFKERTATSRKAIGDIKTSSLPSSQKRKCRRPWSDTERKIVEHHFKDLLHEMKTPGKVDCQRLLNENQTLRDNGRDWKAVKYFMHNKIIANKKRLCQQY